MNLELLSSSDKFDPDECNSECLPSEESLNKDLRNAKRKTPEELNEEWEEHCQKSKIEAEEYIEHIENLKYDLIDSYVDNDDEYSSSEAIPTCNPWE